MWIRIGGVCLGLIFLSSATWGETIRWTTITRTTETTSVGTEVIQSVWVPDGQTWTLNSGVMQYPSSMVCHVWENDASGNPVHIPYLMWGNTTNYLVLPTITVHGPVALYLWCAATAGPQMIFYSLEWTVTP